MNVIPINKDKVKATKEYMMEISNHFKDAGINERKYIEFHKFRYVYLIHTIGNLVEEFNGTDDLKILDVGPAYQTSLIREYFPGAKVDTLGFSNHRNNLRKGEIHYQQDLNEINKHWEIENKRYHIIVFCEIIEHLYTKPELCLEKLTKSLLRNGRIIIQTPNAVALHKRAQLLFGSNPFSLLEESRTGHFREYTSKELKKILDNVGLKTELLEMKNYFNSNTSILNKLYVKLERIVPMQLRDGITIVGIK